MTIQEIGTGPPLISELDVADFMGKELADLNVVQLFELIDDASDSARTETGQALHYIGDDTIELVGPSGTALVLPEIPVVDVGDVIETRHGTDTTLELGKHYRLELGHDRRLGIIRRLAGRWPIGDPVTVTYSHGYALPHAGSDSGADAPLLPGAIRGVLVRACARVYTNPTGDRQETIGRYSVTHGFGSSDTNRFTASELALLERFRRGGAGGST